MKLKFSLTYKTVAHTKSQKQPSKQKYKISVLFFQESILFKHVASTIFRKNKSTKRIFFKNCLFGCFRKVDEAREKINVIVKLPIILKLLIKNKGNKASEYCFNKDVFINTDVSTQSAVDNTMSTQVKKQN